MRDVDHRRLDEGPCVLVVDDDPDSARVLERILESAGFVVDAVESAASAQEQCTVRRYDVILMDLDMPGVDGFTAARRIREWERSTNRRPIPIIPCSTRAPAGVRQSCSASGMDGFVQKPVDASRLIYQVLYWAGRARTIGYVPKTIG